MTGTDEIPDELVDRAYDALCIELDHWRITTPEANGACTAVRDENIEMKMAAIAHIAPRAEGSILGSGARMIRFKEKRYATACVQWHGLRAAIAAVKGELVPSTSNDEGAPNTSDAQLNAPSNGEHTS